MTKFLHRMKSINIKKKKNLKILFDLLRLGMAKKLTGLKRKLKYQYFNSKK